MNSLRAACIISVFSIILVACGGGSPSTANSPELAVTLPVQALIDNDLDAFLRHTAPAEDYAEMQSEWADPNSHNHDEINQQLDILLSDGGIDNIMPMVEMMLADMDPEEMAQGIEFMGGMMLSMALGDPSAAQQAQGIIGAAAAHVRTAGINDPAKARKAMELIADGLRTAEIRTSEDITGLEFSAAMRKLSPVVAACKQALLLYGLDANAVLRSISAKAEGETVAVDGRIFNESFSVPVPVHQAGEIWKVGATVE